MAVLGIILGICTCIFGIYSLATPFQTSLAIGWIAGILLLLYGIEMAVGAMKSQKKNIWLCILGVITAIAGVILIFSGLQRFMTDMLAAMLFGIAIVCYGIYQIVAGMRRMAVSKGMGIAGIIIGVISVIAGLLSVGHPIITLISLGYLIGFILIFQGINMIFIALSAGKAKE